MAKRMTAVDQMTTADLETYVQRAEAFARGEGDASRASGVGRGRCRVSESRTTAARCSRAWPGRTREQARRCWPACRHDACSDYFAGQALDRAAVATRALRHPLTQKQWTAQIGHTVRLDAMLAERRRGTE